MPISFNCQCGKALRVADAHAGRRVKCPACQAIGTVPAPEPEFEVVEDPSEQLVSPPPAPKPRPVAKAAPPRDEDEDDDRGYSVANTNRDDEDEAPRAKKKPDFRKGSGRTDDDEDEDEDEDRPKKKKKKWKKQPAAERAEHRPDNTGINAGVGGGILLMLIAIVWFVVGIAALDVIFFYPPIMFIIGLIAFFKGLAGGE